MVERLQKFHLPLPYPDENCYGILCRFAVRSGWHSTHQVCREVFGYDAPLSGYLFRPFKIADIRKWSKNGGILYGSNHSCFQYFSVFLEEPDREQLKKSSEGSMLKPRDEKRLSRKIGIRAIRKKRLWYCPLCIREDFRRYGETCWRRTPQMPGVSYCPTHGVRLVESGVETDELDYKLIPANYAASYIPEPGTDVGGNVFEKEFLSIASDTSWLLQHGFEYPDYNGTLRAINEATNGRGIRRIYAKGGKRGGAAHFEEYLANRMMKDMGTDDLNDGIRIYLGLVLTIERLAGSVDRFW